MLINFSFRLIVACAPRTFPTSPAPRCSTQIRSFPPTFKRKESGAGTSVTKYILRPPLKMKKRNGVVIFDTKKSRDLHPLRFFRFPQALGHSTRLLRRSFGFCLALLEICREVGGREERKVALPAGAGGDRFFATQSRLAFDFRVTVIPPKKSKEL
jgi:hypothetical protein